MYAYPSVAQAVARVEQLPASLPVEATYRWPAGVHAVAYGEVVPFVWRMSPSRATAQARPIVRHGRVRTPRTHVESCPLLELCHTALPDRRWGCACLCPEAATQPSAAVTAKTATARNANVARALRLIERLPGWDAGRAEGGSGSGRRPGLCSIRMVLRWLPGGSPVLTARRRLRQALAPSDARSRCSRRVDIRRRRQWARRDRRSR
jgi:hypothetical protein